MTTYPGDFQRTSHILHTPQWETVNRFATHLKHIAPLAEIALLQIAVSNNLIVPLSKNHLFSDGDTNTSKAWREVVSHYTDVAAGH